MTQIGHRLRSDCDGLGRRGKANWIYGDRMVIAKVDHQCRYGSLLELLLALLLLRMRKTMLVQMFEQVVPQRDYPLDHPWMGRCGLDLSMTKARDALPV